MNGRGCLSAICGVATIVMMVVLFTPVTVQAQDNGITQSISCGMPLGPRLADAAQVDQDNARGLQLGQNERTDYHGQCADKLNSRRTWAIPIGILAFAIALAAAGHLHDVTADKRTKTNNKIAHA